MATRSKRQPDHLRQGIRRRIVQVTLTTALQAAVLFAAAGRLDWTWAWVFLGLYLAGIAFSAVFMFQGNPEKIAERGRSAGIKSWDRVIGGLWAILYFIILLLVAGLDVRFGWSGPLPLFVHLAGGLVFVLGFGLFIWAMLANTFFAAVARIQSERGQRVCDSGPYRWVRHPGYSGAILQSLGLPLLLGSLWALIPGAAAALLMITRTVLEDRMLQSELHGYTQYAGQVRYRLLPGLW